MRSNSLTKQSKDSSQKSLRKNLKPRTPPLQYRLRHMQPGRIRFYLPAFQNTPGLTDHLEAACQNLNGVLMAKGNPRSGSLLVIYNPAQPVLGKVLALFYNSEKLPPIDADANSRNGTGSRRPSGNPLRLQFAAVLGTGIILGVLALTRFLARWFPGLQRVPERWIASATALAAGVPIFREGWGDMVEERRLSLDFVVSIAVLIAIFFMGEGLVALEVVWLMNCGTLLEAYTEERSRRAILNLLEVEKERVWLVKDGQLIQVPIEQISPGNLIAVHTGEKILVDGEIVSGEASIKESSITGESIPVEKSVGQTVFAGTVVELGTIHIRASRVGDETYLARVLHMVEESLQTRAPIERISDQFARWFVPSAFLFSILVFAVTRNFYRAFTVLVTACPCAASIATPTAVSAAIGNAARRKMLVKGGAFIEQACRIDTICLDKTGTLTEGKPRVATVISGETECSATELAALAASAEARSHHPLAHALLEHAERNRLKLHDLADFKILSGSGIIATLKDGRTIRVGSRRLMESEWVSVEKYDGEAERLREQGETLLYVAIEHRLAGLIGVVDSIRPEAERVVTIVRQSGITPYLLTGDHEQSAKAVSRQTGIDHYSYDMLPEDKANFVDNLKKKGLKVAMVGDGVNDALTLAHSDLGIAMGAGGSDVAVEAADIVLMGNDLSRLPALRELSLKTLVVIKQNYVYSMGVNAFGIGLGSLGLISPLTGGLLHVLNSLGVILNSSRILLVKDQG